MFEHVFDIDATASEAELRDVVARCERLKATAAAAQARATALWAAQRRAAEEAAGVPSRRRGRGLASEIALARHEGVSDGLCRSCMSQMEHDDVHGCSAGQSSR